MEKIKTSQANRNCGFCLLIGWIALGMMFACAKPYGKIRNASGPSIQASPLGAMTTKEPQPFFKPTGRSSATNSTGSLIALVDLDHNEVWLIVKLKVTSSEKVKLKNMADIVFVSPAGRRAPGYVEERIFSLSDPLSDKYDVVWDSLNSERTLLPGTSELNVAFQILDGSASQGKIKLLNAKPIRIHGFFEQ